MRLFKLRKNENGQSMVEFALVLPILVLLVMAIIQFGIIFSAQVALTNAVREGARAAIVGIVLDDSTEGDVESIVRNALGAHRYVTIPTGNILMNSVSAGETVTVEVNNAEIVLLVPVPDIFIPGQIITIDAKASMRKEGYD